LVNLRFTAPFSDKNIPKHCTRHGWVIAREGYRAYRVQFDGRRCTDNKIGKVLPREALARWRFRHPSQPEPYERRVMLEE
jgi:hypothetical protein